MFPFLCVGGGGGGGGGEGRGQHFYYFSRKKLIQDVSVSCSRRPDEEGVR